MVNNTIHATYTETYDVNTIQDELSLLAIHTPQAPSLKRMFHGFFEQYKKFKVLGCNFRMVCAARQDLDPTLAGSGAGQIDPRNVLNPILFKACTGEHIDMLCDQIYNKSEEVMLGNYQTGSISQHIDHTQAVSAYYALLADDSWRKEHPQRGITVMGLKPMVHKVVTTQPFKWSVKDAATTDGVNDQPRIAGGNSNASNTVRGFGAQSGSNTTSTDPVNYNCFVSNGITEMPWLDTAYTQVCTYTDGSGQESDLKKAALLCSNVPRVYMGALVLPPAIGETGNLYFRIQINWHILFKDFRPAQDLMPIYLSDPINTEDVPVSGQELIEGVNTTYYNLYHTSSKLAKDYGSFDTSGIESVDKITEKVQ